MPKVVAKKPAKIDFYKFVKPEKARTSDPAQKGLVEVLNKNIQATNNQGSTINSIGNVLKDFVDTQRRVFESISGDVDTGFAPQFTGPQTDDDDEVVEVEELEGPKMPGFLEAIFNLFKDFMVLALAQPVMKWLSNPENTAKIKKTIEVLGKFFKAVSTFLGDRIVGLIDNLYTFFDPSKNWWDKLGSLLKGLADFAGLFMAIRWLTNPLKILEDIGTVFKLLIKTLTGSKKKLKKALKRAGVAGLLIGGGILAYNAMTKEDLQGEAGKDGADGETPEMAKGGFIQGPMSGYPVSLDGGKSTAFIGHGTEYVAQKSKGGYVVPIDTPATRVNPGLMGQRMTEGQNMGFNMDTFFGSSFQNHGYAEGGQIDMDATNEEKWAQIKGMALKAGSKYPNLVAAQFANESDWGRAVGGKHNYYGLKAVPGTGGTASATWEEVNGQRVDQVAEFINFKSAQDATDYLVKLWYKDYKGYKGANNATDVNGALDVLQAGTYFTDSKAPDKLKVLMKNYAGIKPVLPKAIPVDPNKKANEKNFDSAGNEIKIGDIVGGPPAEPAGSASTSEVKKPVNPWESFIKGMNKAFSGGTQGALEGLSGLSSSLSSAFSPASLKDQLSNINADGTSGSRASTKTIQDTKEKVDAAKTEKKQAQLTMIQQVQQIAQSANEKVKSIAARHAEQTASAENAAKSKKPTVLPTGNTHIKDLVSILNSGNNPLKVFD
tara:strand:+ start:399 stop:2549 length:2151 start_codon:yes stop_codon:yes gene_type:complete